MQLVASLPPALREGLLRRVPLVETRQAFENLFRTARFSIKIIAPYVDPTFTGLLQGVAAPIYLVTTAASGRPPRPNPVLERCAGLRNLHVRYLEEQKDHALMYQAHAKLVLVDGQRAYIGSATLIDTSLHYNLELGLLVDGDAMSIALDAMFEFLYEHVAVPASRLGGAR